MHVIISYIYFLISSCKKEKKNPGIIVSKSNQENFFNSTHQPKPAFKPPFFRSLICQNRASF